MSTEITKSDENLAIQGIKTFFSTPDIMNKFREMLGNRASQFITSVLQIISTDSSKFAKVLPQSIYNCALLAATLDLPINNQLGFAYIIPYGVEAQFQLGYRAYIQLAQRSGQFKSIAAAPIYAGQLVSENPLTGYEFDFTRIRESNNIIGYAAYFKLLNGFEKTFYMTTEELKEHAKKYSQVYKKFGNGLWRDDFDAMAQKTVIKLLLSKFAPLSVEMQKAVIVDQALIKNADTLDISYIDNPGSDDNAQENGREKKAIQGTSAVGAVASKSGAKARTEPPKGRISYEVVETIALPKGMLVEGSIADIEEEFFIFTLDTGVKVSYTADEMAVDLANNVRKITQAL